MTKKVRVTVRVIRNVTVTVRPPLSGNTVRWPGALLCAEEWSRQERRWKQFITQIF